MEAPMGFGIVDYVIIGGSLVVCMIIPFFTGRKKKTEKPDFIYGEDGKNGKETQEIGTVDEYLLGSRKMSVIPVAFSLTATMLSANSMTGTTGEIFINGIQFLLMSIGFIIGQILIAKWIVPVLHNIKIVSIYEYMELRFDRSLRLIFSVLFLFINLVMNGVFLFAPAISFTTITGLPYWITSSITGTVCTLYCIAGGLKAVIWTDVFQTILIFISIIMVAVQGTIDGGGIVQIFKDTFEGKMEEHFTLVDDFSKRYSVCGIIVFGVVCCLYGTVSSQAGAQRLLSVKNSSQAQKSLILSVVLLVIFEVLIIFAAVAVFAKFTNCNPLQRPETGVFLPDQLLIYAAGKMLGHVPGLLGIAMAGLISAALSTISSFINSFAACTLEDYLKPFFPNFTASDKRNLIICKILTAFYGVVSIALSLAVPYLGGIIRVLFAIIGALSGPLTGVLFLAFFFRKANAYACKLSIAISLAFSLWMSIGSLLYPVHTTGVTHSIKDCPPSNFTLGEAFLQHSPAQMVDAFGNHTTLPSAAAPQGIMEAEEDDIFPLYKVPVMWILPISTAITCVIAIILSYAFGLKHDPDPKLLSPLVAPKYHRLQVQRIKRDDVLRAEENYHLKPLKV